MRYLRKREDFFARQLAAIPSQVPVTVQDKGLKLCTLMEPAYRPLSLL